MTRLNLPLSADATDLAQLIADGSISAQEALTDAVQRAERLNPKINAVCSLAVEQAQDVARQIDHQLVAARKHPEQLASMRVERPFLGVPTLLKDMTTAATGLPSKLGSRLFGDVHWPLDSELVRRYRQAGFVMFGRTTTPEMAISPSTEAAVYSGPTRNPWNTDHSPGGSSGGASAALAARIVRIAHGTDGAGSIRIPAACCGVVGLKPTRGLIPAGPLAGEGWGGLLAEHMLSLSVRDCAAALDVTAGIDLGAPYAAPTFAGSLAGVQAVSAGLKLSGLRIAVLEQTLDGKAIDPQVAQTVRRIADLLAGLGHRVRDAKPPLSTEQVLHPLIDVVACGTAMAIDAEVARRGRPLAQGELEPTTLGAWRHGRSLSGPQYLQALSQMHRMNRIIAAFFEGETADQGFDFMLMPVLAETPARLGRWAMSNPDFLDYRLGPQGLIHYSPYTPLANMTGQPAISLPLGMSHDGLPIGVQLLGRFGQDAQLLQLSAQLEREHPWAQTLPALAAEGDS